MDEIKRDLDFIMKAQNPAKLTIRVHAFTEAYLRQGFWSLLMQWRREYRKWIRVQSDSDYHMLQYHFFGDNDEEIRLS